MNHRDHLENTSCKIGLKLEVDGSQTLSDDDPMKQWIGLAVGVMMVNMPAPKELSWVQSSMIFCYRAKLHCRAIAKPAIGCGV